MPSSKLAWKINIAAGLFHQNFCAYFYELHGGSFSHWFYSHLSHFLHFFKCVYNISKHETQLYMERGLLACGGWKLAGVLSLWKYVGRWENLHNSYGFITPTSIAFERQVTKKGHICPIVTLSTQFSHAKVGASFYLSYLWICIMYILSISKVFTLPITCHAVFQSL